MVRHGTCLMCIWYNMVGVNEGGSTRPACTLSFAFASTRRVTQGIFNSMLRYLYPTSYTERGCFFFFDPYLCILYFHFGCLFVICLLILTVYHTFIPNLFLKFSKLNTKPEGTPTPNHRTPFIVGFGGSGIVESISSNNADEQTRALLHKRVVFIAQIQIRMGVMLNMYWWIGVL